MSLKKNQTTKIKGIIMIEIYNQIKDNKLSVKQAADLFVKMHPETLKSAMRKFCKENNLESPFQKRGRPKIALVLKSDINQLIEENKNKE